MIQGYKHDPKTYMQFYSLKIQKGDIATARCFKKVCSFLILNEENGGEGGGGGAFFSF